MEYSELCPELCSGNYFNEQEWLNKTYNSIYPTIPELLFHFFDCQFSGPLVVVAAKDYTFFLKEEKLEKKYQHDRDNRQEVIVPLLFTGPNIKKDFEFKMARNVDIVPTILKWLGIESKDKFDGRILSEIFE